jgi:serine protease Do
MAKEILVQLREKGRVTRGWLGVAIQEITPELAKSFGLREEKGALISDVAPGGPAEKAGFKRGDVILELNGKTVKDYHELPRMVASMPVGDKVTLKVLRDGKEMMIPATVGELKDDAVVKPSEEVDNRMGISLHAVTPDIAAELGMKKAEGVVVTNVEPGGQAGEAGIQKGDVILEVDRNAVNSLKEFNETIKKADKSMLFLIYRSGSTFYVTIGISPKEN